MKVDQKHTMMIDIIIERRKSGEAIEDEIYTLIEEYFRAYYGGKELAEILNGDYGESDFYDEFGRWPTRWYGGN